jgi:hypothetical protein
MSQNNEQAMDRNNYFESTLNKGTFRSCCFKFNILDLIIYHFHPNSIGIPALENILGNRTKP